MFFWNRESPKIASRATIMAYSSIDRLVRAHTLKYDTLVFTRVRLRVSYGYFHFVNLRYFTDYTSTYTRGAVHSASSAATSAGARHMWHGSCGFAALRACAA